MLSVRNQFHENSIDYRTNGKTIVERLEDVENLQEVYDCCVANDERIECDIDSLYQQEVEPDEMLVDWLFSGDMEDDYDLRRMLMAIFQTFSEMEEERDCTIHISMGTQDGCICDEKGYWSERRKHLKEICKTSEFYEFMKTCFVKTEFSDVVGASLREIDDFAQHTEEIVHNLSLLNDEAIEIYERHNRSSKDAIRELASKALDCSGDPKHKDMLKFPFSYFVEGNGEKQAEVAEIVCEPHMKLIRRDSDLRIYFYWRDNRIANGEKVLIGKIGRHPYK